MNPLNIFLAALRQPRVLRPSRRILLLSHMRANTSLFGHLLAENPEVDGYYELHMGYHSWKSLLRQKLRYASHDRLKTTSTYMFDKVLHNDHYVNMDVFSRAKIVFMLRPPARTLPSIVSLYRTDDPLHSYATPEGAADYYLKRLDTLSALMRSAQCDIFYIDADALRSNAKESLERLSSYLELKSPLTEHYSERSMTGQPRGGDSSELIRSGQIVPEFRDYSGIEFTEDVLAVAQAKYLNTRDAILESPRLFGHVLDEATGNT